MPLSKKRMRERKQQDRAVKPDSFVSNLVKPNSKEKRLELARQALTDAVKPKTDAPQSISSPIKEETSSRLSPELDAGGEKIPDYW